MDNPVFEQIKEKSPQKGIESLCNKLLKRCSFKSGEDMENLCHLAYWLYLYKQEGLVISCVALTKTIAFNKDFRVWDFVLNMWGLEARILRE